MKTRARGKGAGSSSVAQVILVQAIVQPSWRDSGNGREGRS